MKLIKLKRTFFEGLDNFRRNGWLSFATVSVLAISLYVISVTFILGVTTNIILKNIQDDLSVSVYFNSDIEENTILDIKNKLVVYDEIKSIDYVTKEQALENFKKITNNSDSISRALELIGDNPLLSSLVIKAKNPEQYGIITQAISKSSFADSISNIDFEEHKEAVQRLNSIVKLVEKIGFTLGLVFIFIGIMITFNAIRLTMYAHKSEFEVMRLVGASNVYIRMPFVFEGIFYGVASAFLVMIFLGITSKFLAPITQNSISGENIFSFYLDNFFIIFISLIFSGIALGTISGLIAIKRYLKV
ncbi:MAG TPA: permease-like cell division protein FtsX [Candidatus Moranbacteria bacterium]|nr:permease-like cell division protein FtsX [Candidatus Moranbacteria bacterium]HRZ33710.1 permease-like cell division protein FtsX [Candidatus Moranbacteria bacterium]